MSLKRIAGGTIVDGTGKSGFVGELLIEGDRIVDVVPGGLPSDAATDIDTLDATGMLVTPGFIDAHSHSDAYLVLEPNAPSKLSQGITTEINGQCGGSVAPRFGEARLSSDWAALLGDRLTWHSLSEYREVLSRDGIAVNTVQFIGHNTLRSSVIGYAGRTATEDELKAMRKLLEQSLDEGGWGLTTGLIYQPGRYSTPEEVATLAEVTAKRGGYYATHMRSEGDDILAAIDEVLDLVRTTGIRAEISHLKTSGRRNWNKIDAVLEKVDAAVADGLLLGSDRYPFCAAGTDLDVVLPDWAQEGASAAEQLRVKHHGLRTKIVDELNASSRDWTTVMIGGTWHPDNKQFSGHSVADILAMVQPKQSVGELIVSILEKDGFKTGAFFFSMCEENLAKIYSRPYIVPGSDASLRAPWGPLGADHPHPRAYATMPEFYRRVRALGFSREATIARMTSVTARRFGIGGRGTLEKGAFADVVVWDENAFSSRSTFAEPHHFSDGVRAVYVNGEKAFGDGSFTGSRSGRFLDR